MIQKQYCLLIMIICGALTKAESPALLRGPLEFFAQYEQCGKVVASIIASTSLYATYRACKEETWRATWQRYKWLIATAILGGTAAALLRNIAYVNKKPCEDLPFYFNPLSAVSILARKTLVLKDKYP